MELKPRNNANALRNKTNNGKLKTAETILHNKWYCPEMPNNRYWSTDCVTKLQIL